MNIRSRIECIAERIAALRPEWWQTRDGQVSLLRMVVEMNLRTCPPSPDTCVAKYKAQMLEMANALARGHDWAEISAAELESVFERNLGQLASTREGCGAELPAIAE